MVISIISAATSTYQITVRLSERGVSFSESYARKLWNRITEEMGIDISFYQGTRHSSATEDVNRVGMDVVQEFLGHTRPAMTKRYARVSTNRLKVVFLEKGGGKADK